MITAKLGTTTYETPSDHEVLIARIFDAPRALVFKAHTDPKHIRQWLGGFEGWTMPVCEVDLRLGGAWRYVFEKNGGEMTMTLSGIFKEIVPDEKTVTTESWGPDWPETLNTLVFHEEAGRTTMMLTIAYVSKEARDAALQTGMVDGVNVSYARLDALLRELA